MDAKPWSMIEDTCCGYGPAITLGIAFFIAVTFGVQVFTKTEEKAGDHVAGVIAGIVVGILVFVVVKHFTRTNCMMSEKDTPGWQEWHKRAGQGFDKLEEGVPMVDFLLLQNLTEKKFNYKKASLEDSFWKCFNCCS